MEVSVVIPVGRNEVNFNLIEQLNQKFPKFEIIVAASASNLNLKLIENKVSKILKIQNSSRSVSLNAGALESSHDLIWFLHLDSDINEITIEHFNEINEDKINTFKLMFDDQKLKINSKGANFRTKYFGLPFGDQSFLVHKKIFYLIGRFSEILNIGEDHEFIWKAKQIGIKVKLINANIYTSGSKYEFNRFIQTIKTIKNMLIQIFKFARLKKKYVVCYFLKDPKSTKSKSRLREDLPNEFVNEINESLLEIITSSIKEIKKHKNIFQIIVCTNSQKNYGINFSKISDGLMITSQEELGKSMREVLELNLKFFKKVVLVGADIPLLNSKDIVESLKIKNAKTVFYPTNDGGFCLLAVTDQSLLDIIDKIKYGTDTVLTELSSKLSSVLILNKFYQDIDNKMDLKTINNEMKKNFYNLNFSQRKFYNLLNTNKEKFN